MKKIFVIIPAYNSSTLIEEVIKRIPKAIWKKISKIVIINDCSTDNTSESINKIVRTYPNIHVINKKQNEGYAKAQKTGFTYALKNNADIVVLLHSDGQYAPEEMPRLLEPLEKGDADVVQGSRMMEGKAMEGNMPIYKFIANKILSKLENIVYGTNVAEFHSGYMLYSRKALETIPFHKLSNTFHFDGEMIFMAHKRGLRFKELAIPTRYAGEKSNLLPIQYGLDVLKIIWNYKRGKYNF